MDRIDIKLFKALTRVVVALSFTTCFRYFDTYIDVAIDCDSDEVVNKCKCEDGLSSLIAKVNCGDVEERVVCFDSEVAKESIRAVKESFSGVEVSRGDIVKCMS